MSAPNWIHAYSKLRMVLPPNVRLRYIAYHAAKDWYGFFADEGTIWAVGNEPSQPIFYSMIGDSGEWWRLEEKRKAGDSNASRDSDRHA